MAHAARRPSEEVIMITVALLVTTLLLPVPQQDSALRSAAVGPWVECASADQDLACTHLARARDLMLEERWREAGRELERAVRARQAAGQYPGEELWQLAAYQYQDGKLRRAARTLDTLATEARRNGDLHRHATALMEAAILYYELREHDVAATRVDRLRPLLHSPYLPTATSEVVRQRIPGI
jgi:tetratricopeptide (TPR) repeat protein